jgi:hypothetical protein
MRDRERGTREFIGGSNLGNAVDIAMGKASNAGYDLDDCHKRAVR